VTIVGVSGRDDPVAMEDFVARHAVDNVRHVADVDGQVWSRFGVVAQPWWIFIDGQTGAMTQEFGHLGVETLAERLTALESA
jgi:hypothetical protein